MTDLTVADEIDRQERQDRHIDCDAAFNIRDLGGYRTTTGRTVRWRTLFRADGLHRIPSSSLAAVRVLGWRTVLDLRTVVELDSGRYADEDSEVDLIHLPLLRETWDPSAFEQSDDAIAFLSSRYLDMADHGAPAVAAAFEILSSPTRLPAVFHCSAGKDRTGILAALVLETLGVSDDQIADDYHLSARAMDQLVAWVIASRPEAAEHMARQPRAFLACPPEAMVGFLDGLRHRYGSVEGYLAQIGVTHETVTALRASLLD